MFYPDYSNFSIKAQIRGIAIDQIGVKRKWNSHSVKKKYEETRTVICQHLNQNDGAFFMFKVTSRRENISHTEYLAPTENKTQVNICINKIATILISDLRQCLLLIKYHNNSQVFRHCYVIKLSTPWDHMALLLWIVVVLRSHFKTCW